MNFFESTSKGIREIGYSFYGIRATDIEAVKENISARTLSSRFIDIDSMCGRDITSTLEDYVNFYRMSIGNLAYVQKGRNSYMKSPFIITDIIESEYGISVEFEPIRNGSVDTTLYMQVDKSVLEEDVFVNPRRDTDYVSAKSSGRGSLADNGGFCIVPDDLIISKYPDLVPDTHAVATLI